MVNRSQIKLSTELKILEAQLRECYARVVYAHKVHEKCADILLEKQSRIKVWQLILSALTTSGFLATILGSGRCGAIFGGLVSLLLLILNAYVKNYDLGELAQKHKQAANNIWLIREQYLSLLTDLLMGKNSVEDLLYRRDHLLNDLDAVYKGCPSSNIKAYKKAQEALKVRKDMTFSAEEIDAFLPLGLKSK